MAITEEDLAAAAGEKGGRTDGGGTGGTVVIPIPTATPLPNTSGTCREYNLTTTAQAGSDVTVTVNYTNCINNLLSPNTVINLPQEASAYPDSAGQQLFSTTICSKSQPTILSSLYEIGVTDIGVCGANPVPTPTPTLTLVPPTPTPTLTLTPTPTSTPAPTSVPINTTYITTLIASPSEGGTVSGTSLLTPTPGTVIASRVGERTDFQATANAGYTFTGWYLNGLLWSTNYSPAILSDKNNTYEARFAANPTQDTCKCYFVAPTTQGQPFEVIYRPCSAGSVRTSQTFTSFTNICSADIPQSGRNAQVPQNLNKDCSNGQTCGAPAPTPTPTVPPEFIRPTPTPVLEIIPRWRDCISEELFNGVPTNRREVIYTGPGGGTCWEPLTQVTFNPNLNSELIFQYQRGSAQYPMSQVITATNASTRLVYEIQITTNTNIAVTPNKFTIAPRSNVQFTVQTTANLLNQLGDGTSRLQMSVSIREL